MSTRRSEGIESRFCLHRVAIQLTTPNHYCHNTTHFVGSVEIAFRHLKKLGYRLVIVSVLCDHRMLIAYVHLV